MFCGTKLGAPTWGVTTVCATGDTTEFVTTPKFVGFSATNGCVTPTFGSVTAKDIADELNKNYIEDKLRVISSYIKSITKKEDDVKLTVIVDFDDGRQLWFYYMNVLPLIREHNGELVYHSGDAEVESYSPYEYMERLEKFNG